MLYIKNTPNPLKGALYPQASLVPFRGLGVFLADLLVNDGTIDVRLSG